MSEVEKGIAIIPPRILWDWTCSSIHWLVTLCMEIGELAMTWREKKITAAENQVTEKNKGILTGDVTD